MSETKKRDNWAALAALLGTAPEPEPTPAPVEPPPKPTTPAAIESSAAVDQPRQNETVVEAAVAAPPAAPKKVSHWGKLASMLGLSSTPVVEEPSAPAAPVVPPPVATTTAPAPIAPSAFGPAPAAPATRDEALGVSARRDASGDAEADSFPASRGFRGESRRGGRGGRGRRDRWERSDNPPQETNTTASESPPAPAPTSIEADIVGDHFVEPSESADAATPVAEGEEGGRRRRRRGRRGRRGRGEGRRDGAEAPSNLESPNVPVANREEDRAGDFEDDLHDELIPFDAEASSDLNGEEPGATPPAEGLATEEDRPRRRRRRGRRGRRGGRRDEVSASDSNQEGSSRTGTDGSLPPRSGGAQPSRIRSDAGRGDGTRNEGGRIEGGRSEGGRGETSRGDSSRRDQRGRRDLRGPKVNADLEDHDDLLDDDLDLLDDHDEPEFVEAHDDVVLDDEHDDHDDHHDDLLDDHDDEGGEIHASHRKIPTWDETVGILISANMESRARNPNSGGGHHRGGGRGRGGRGR